MRAYYNDSDRKTAAWLAELVHREHLTQGRVDSRSIARVHPDEVRQATRCHFFAGIGGWDLALQLAGWPADAPVWTGSCPCQPFSTAGRKRRFDDARHLWPTFFALIERCRPPIVFGEQVASPAGRAWLDAVFDDLEGAGYACGAAILPASAVGAPHMRHRLFFVAKRKTAAEKYGNVTHEAVQKVWSAQAAVEGVNANRTYGKSAAAVGRNQTIEPLHAYGEGGVDSSRPPYPDDARICAPHVEARGLGDAGRAGSGGNARAVSCAQAESPEQRFGARRIAHELVAAGATGGAWADAEWWQCTDGKTRPAQRGAFPLVDGTSDRVVRLRGYGNAIVPEVAATFVRAVMGALGG